MFCYYVFSYFDLNSSVYMWIWCWKSLKNNVLTCKLFLNSVVSSVDMFYYLWLVLGLNLLHNIQSQIKNCLFMSTCILLFIKNDHIFLSITRVSLKLRRIEKKKNLFRLVNSMIHSTSTVNFLHIRPIKVCFTLFSKNILSTLLYITSQFQIHLRLLVSDWKFNYLTFLLRHSCFFFLLIITSVFHKTNQGELRFIDL